ncbi:hypothetical protein [Micromonospora maris]|uniref:hypothetical protein n=1 Tax=Micromonospora maris TaxID=1003110 RepID=UPI000206B36C|nr:hypothetical protein [Micromonospora maris]AEB47997.1 hypothetical protein VAB18032_30169 [Micromonospora maris AB-18-032]
MTSSVLVLLGVVYIVLAVVFAFTPRLRVLVGLMVGGLMAGAVVSQVNKWLASGIGKIAGPIGDWIGQDTKEVAVAIPSALGLALGIVVVVFLRGKGTGKSAIGGKGAVGGKGAAGGGGGFKKHLPHIALACALLLPMVLGGLGETIRDVVQ